MESMILKEHRCPISEEDGDKSHVKPVEDPPEEWAPWNLVVSTKNPHAPPPVSVKTAPGPVWDIGQVVKAAQLLCKPPLHVDFTDEQEMRCVYSLIYDVFRYKTILDQAIEDVDFLGDFPQYVDHRHAVWLFLMELARRRWGARPRKETERAIKLLEAVGSPFKEIENEIWDQRVHFAAAIARIRIKNKAFSLSELLPPHLREERSACVYKDTVTGWVNTFKAKKVALLVKHLHELGYSYSNSRQLCAGEYRFDRVCPRFITLRPPADVGIGQLDLVRDGVIVLQEREFCEGASTLCRALRANALRGVVAQTHASSPRCSAYLAAQLRELAAVLKAKAPAAPATPELGRLVVFGAGDKVESYVCALRELGIEASLALHSDAPVLVLKEQVYCDTPAVASALDGVVAVLATPPNSYSAVTDPIDLVCGRGGDLNMLEILTESEIDGAGKARVQSILEEQKKTLRTLMSKPQIQLILYETHSALEAENQAQVTRAIAEANRLARERYALLKKKHRQTSPQKHASGADPAITESSVAIENTARSDIDKDDRTDDSISNPSPKQPDTGTLPSTYRSRPQSPEVSIRKPTDNHTIVSRPEYNKARPIPKMPETGIGAIPKDPDHDNPDIYVPNCDLFESGTLPNLGNGLDINYILDRDGCYLGLIQRKEITRLDAKYMIRVAEERGLFGPGAAPPPQPKRKKPEQAGEHKRKQRKASFQVERVAAPTYASLSRSSRDRRGSAPACMDAGRDIMCAKHARRHAAAAAISAAACTCDARHRPQTHPPLPMQIPSKKESFNISRASSIQQNKPQSHQIHQYRRASADVTKTPRSPTPPCRRPFPLIVHELRLKSILPQYKIVATS